MGYWTLLEKGKTLLVDSGGKDYRFIDFKVEKIKDYDIINHNRLISLYDMLQFYAKPFLSILDSITNLCKYLDIISNQNNANLAVVKLEDPSKFKEDVQLLHSQLQELDFQFTLISIKELEKIISQKSTPFTLTQKDAHLIHDIKKRIMDEFSIKKIFILEEGESLYYNPIIPIFGDKCRNNFPSSDFDITEAGNCFALGRYTACVFHLMRSLENPLKIFAKTIGIEPKNHTNWQNILEQITSKINEMGKEQERSLTWKEDQQYYSQVISHFHVIKNAWRNYTMHGYSKYTEEEAKGILEGCKTFMIQLSSQFNEDKA